MRIFHPLSTSPKNYMARAPQREPVDFQMLLPLKLKKTVSSKSDKTREIACMQEMTLLFSCFKKTEFDQQQCLKEITNFQTCFNANRQRKEELRDHERKGILTPGEKKLTHRQMNQLLKSFPPKK